MSVPILPTEEEWRSHMNVISSLYLGNHEGDGDLEGDPKGQTLTNLARIMETTHGFIASESQYEIKLKAWGLRKNLKPEEWKVVLDRLDKMPSRAKCRVMICGRPVPKSRVQRARRYCKHKFRVSSESCTYGARPPPNLPHQVQIELQGLDGRWTVCSPHTVATISAAISTPLELNQFEAISPQTLSSRDVFSTGPITFDAPSFEVRLPPTPENIGLNITGFTCTPLEGTQQPVAYMLGSPSDWLQELPSKRLPIIAGLEGTDATRSQIGRTHQFTRITEDKIIKAIQRMGINNHVLNNPGLLGLVEQLESFLYGQDHQPEERQNGRLSSPNDMRRSQLTQFLLLAMVNGAFDLNDLTLDTIVGSVCADGTLDKLLLRYLDTAPKHVATTLIMGFFRASLLKGELAIVDQFLREGLSDVNDTFIFNFGSQLTPLEAAAKRGNVEMMDLLLNYGADPNKTYQPNTREGGAWLGFMEGAFDHIPNPSFVRVARRLLDAGAIVHPQTLTHMYGMEEPLLSFLFSVLSPAEHSDFFPFQFWTEVIYTGNDTQGEDLVNKVVSDCVERHSGACMLRFQAQVNWGLLGAAARGRLKTFYAILPHSGYSSYHPDARLLSASIRGENRALIEFVMARQPDINPPPHRIDHDGGDEDWTTPLKESIQTENYQLLEVFVKAGILGSLHLDERFKIALDAAVDENDVELVARLLDACPDLEAQNMVDPLIKAIDTSHESLALMLIERGASIYLPEMEPTYGDCEYPCALCASIEKGNISIIRKLLETGVSHETSGIRFFGKRSCKKILQSLLRMESPSTAEDVLSSFLNYQDLYDCTVSPSELDPNRKLSYSGEPNYVFAKSCLSALENEEMRGLMLGPRLATVSMLTAYLTAAVYRNNLSLVHDLIERGADTLDETVLMCAVQSNPSMLPLLMREMARQRPVVTKGLRTAVLKTAIQQGPKSAKIVSMLIKSGAADIFDTGPNSEMTPMGVAIWEARNFPQFSYETVKLLLDFSCDPNSVVRFGRTSSSLLCINQTALLEAIATGNKKVTKLLLDRGAHVNGKLPYLVRRTPLQKAAEMGDVEMVRLLLEHKANVNAEPSISLGGTALQLAAISGNCALVAELMSHGALLHMPPSKIGGRWPIEGAAEHGRLDMIQFLWTANEETVFFSEGDNGFQEKNFLKAMRLAKDNGHIGCRDMIADLAGLPVTATDVPPVVSPLYIDWPPPGWSVD
ncbi:ankyrin [Xylariaceae sp. FL1651]|nr:ankyrin [Xylariaceae sp. FL1651]